MRQSLAVAAAAWSPGTTLRVIFDENVNEKPVTFAYLTLKDVADFDFYVYSDFFIYTDDKSAMAKSILMHSCILSSLQPIFRNPENLAQRGLIWGLDIQALNILRVDHKTPVVYDQIFIFTQECIPFFVFISL